MSCPILGARGTLRPEGSGSLGVLILGEAMGEHEANDGLPFRPYAPAGSVLERAIRRGGMSRDQFVVWNVVPTQPPKNWLESAPWEAEAIAWGMTFLDDIVARYKPRCILALGGVATRATTGLAGYKMGVSELTGFVLPSPRYNIPVVPCFHPAYLRRGAMSHFGVLLRCLRLATQVARESRQPTLPQPESPPAGYVLYPTQEQAEDFEDSIAGDAIAYDIETPYSTTEDSAEEAEGEHTIKSIQFSLAPGSGIFLPWREPFIPIAKRILALPNPKLGWNIWRFDDPILKANGCEINGERHDLMWAWHHAQPDLPRGLQFAAGQQGWPWPWKHLDQASPQFYGIVDVDVLQWMAT